MAAAKRVLRYLCSTSGMGLVLGGRRPVVLTGHADASWADDQATQRSSHGYTFSLGSGSVSWRSTRSSSVLSSSCEAEIYAGAMAAQELRWLTYLLTDLGEQPRSPPVLYVDNKAMLALCREHRLEHRTKHIALRYFLARELQQRGQLRLAYVASEANTADIFTKALAPGDHQRFCTLLGVTMGSDAAFLLPGIPDDAALMCLAMLPRGYYGVLKCVSRRWKAALEDEHVYSLREQLGRKESWVYVNVYHHPPPSATTASSSSSHSSSFRGGKPPSQIRVESLYAFSPILKKWFLLSETRSPRSSRRIKTVAVKHKQYIFGDDLIICDAVTGACTSGPQLPSGAHLNVQLAASDSHVVFVSASPQIVFGDPESPGDVIVHVLAVSAYIIIMFMLLCLCC
ncbi:unnamed protein product [Closterium sp. NIES-54]